MAHSISSSDSLEHTIETLDEVIQRLSAAKSGTDKLAVVASQPSVQHFLKEYPRLDKWLRERPHEEQFLFYALLALGQGPRLFPSAEWSQPALQQLMETLRELEHTYQAIGGIMGYHVTVLKLIVARQQVHTMQPDTIHYAHPPGVDLSQDTVELRRAIRWGVEACGQIAEIYPVGGAGDRLDLHDEHSGDALPAAQLAFCGYTLLEGLVRDLQGREYLHYKLTGRKVITPIAMMTSHEKDNQRHILKICHERQWFGRSQKNFRFFIQPLVPMITLKGDWVVLGPLHPMLKPGGHGVIWKLAQDQGVIEWLMDQGYKKALVRQINNPIAGTDYGLSGFIGWGYHYGKKFGFASCQRLLNATEGMDVLVEVKSAEGFEYRITNIEYTEFAQHGVQDAPEMADSPYSRFPANTNILFVDLEEIGKTTHLCPIPGMLINMKNKVTQHDSSGQNYDVEAGRLESTMQNIADYMVDRYPYRLAQVKPEQLQSYVTYNTRVKTISVAKRSYKEGKSLDETPEKCFYDLLSNHALLLKEHCKIVVAPLGNETDYLLKGPGFLFLYHPALGPFYRIIGQKIRGGRLFEGAEMQLEVAAVDISDLQLTGSLLITADDVLGKSDLTGTIDYSEQSGKCTLRDVTIENAGIDQNAPNKFWKNQITRHEAVSIILHGNAEFFAADIHLKGAHLFEVPDGHRMMVEMDHGKLHRRLEKILAPTWHWHYTFDQEEGIVLSRIDHA